MSSKEVMTETRGIDDRTKNNNTPELWNELLLRAVQARSLGDAGESYGCKLNLHHLRDIAEELYRRLK